MSYFFKVLAALSVLIFVSSFGQAQTIEMEKSFGSLKFYQDGEVLNLRAVRKLLRENDEAYKIARDAYGLRALGLGLRTTGIFLLVPAVRANNQSSDEQWSLLAWSGGLILISIPFSIFSTKLYVA